MALPRGTAKFIRPPFRSLAGVPLEIGSRRIKLEASRGIRLGGSSCLAHHDPFRRE